MNEKTKKQYIDEINKLIQSREPDILTNYPTIREILKSPYEGFPELELLRKEISCCIVFGLYQAAITLTNHLLEKFLKIALIYRNMDFSTGGNTVVEKIINSTAKSIVKYNTEDMGKNIDAVFRQGIITKEEKKRLHGFRDDFRNAYGHADADKTFKDKNVPLIGGSLAENGLKLEEEQTTEISKVLFLQGEAQLEHAKANAIPYFEYLDSLIRKILPQIFKDHKEQPLS